MNAAERKGQFNLGFLPLCLQPKPYFGCSPQPSFYQGCAPPSAKPSGCRAHCPVLVNIAPRRHTAPRVPSALLPVLPEPAVVLLLTCLPPRACRGTAPHLSSSSLVFAAHQGPGHLHLHQAGGPGRDGEQAPEAAGLQHGVSLQHRAL